MRDDKVFIAYYSGENNAPLVVPFNFNNLAFGSEARCARCMEYDRFIEALKGQGCDVHVWDTHYWPRYRNAFLAGKLLRK